jgi:periplasmic copper chaperone A
MRWRRISVLAPVVAAITLVVSAAAASAHVTVQPSTAEQGGDATLSFVVPNEKDSADTIQLEVQLPTDHPIASVSVQPKAGWSYKVTTTKLAQPVQSDSGPVTEAVSDIVWSGGSIKPGEFDEFTISLGPLPTGVDNVQFKALQTYSDGDVVRWIEATPPGGPEPDHPAPTLTLTKAGTDSTSSGSDDSTARTLGIIGIVVGALGVAFGAGAILVSRRKPKPSTPADQPVSSP